MIRVLFVKSGKHEDPITKATEMEETRVAKAIEVHKLKFLGSTLPPIGESTRMSQFSGPNHVVLDARASTGLRGVDEHGFYLVVGLAPSAGALLIG